jgi:hypothetical protein
MSDRTRQAGCRSLSDIAQIARSPTAPPFFVAAPHHLDDIGHINRRLEMKTFFAIAAFGLTVTAMSPVESYAQSPRDYRYCGLDTSGATECYFNNRVQCRGVGLGCIDNPGYAGE